jgi:ribosomal protein S6E (S10)
VKYKLAGGGEEYGFDMRSSSLGATRARVHFRGAGTGRMRADGATYQEAIANVEIVITERIETATELGRPIPEPKDRLVLA